MITNDEYEKRKEALEGASMVTIWETFTQLAYQVR